LKQAEANAALTAYEDSAIAHLLEAAYVMARKQQVRINPNSNFKTHDRETFDIRDAWKLYDNDADKKAKVIDMACYYA